MFRKGHLLEGVPIAGLIGDQQAALVGNKCLTKGDAKQTYGQSNASLHLLFLRAEARMERSTLRAESRLTRLDDDAQERDASCSTTPAPTSSSRPTDSSLPCVFSPLPLLPSSRPTNADEVGYEQVAYKMGKEGPLHYALEGSIAVGGSSVTWCVSALLSLLRTFESSLLDLMS